jgi:hypothetical protein
MKAALIRSCAVTLLLVLAATSYAQGPHRFQPGFNLFSKQQDVQLGEEAAAQVHKQMTVINDRLCK